MGYMPNALVVKWISHQSSELLLGVRIPPRAPESIINGALRSNAGWDENSGARSNPPGGTGQNMLENNGILSYGQKTNIIFIFF